VEALLEQLFVQNIVESVGRCNIDFLSGVWYLETGIAIEG